MVKAWQIATGAGVLLTAVAAGTYYQSTKATRPTLSKNYAILKDYGRSFWRIHYADQRTGPNYSVGEIIISTDYKYYSAAPEVHSPNETYRLVLPALMLKNMININQYTKLVQELRAKFQV
jgi:hypothetical protein